jgi:hypothetical protein
MTLLDRKVQVKARATALGVAYAQLPGGDTWLFLRDRARVAPTGTVCTGDSVTAGDGAAVVLSLAEFERLKALDA